MTPTEYDTLQRTWVDQFVKINAERPELKRFADVVGRVAAVNWNGKALVDFQDGGWYDIPASDDCLTKLDPTEARDKFDSTVNSAQPFPQRKA